MLGKQVAEQRHELGVELGAGVTPELADRQLVADRPLVGPVVGHRVVRVGDRHDPGAERDVVAAQPEWVAVPGVAFVMVQDDRHGVLEGGGLLEDDLADPRMLDDRSPLRRTESGRLVEDLLGNGDLADVVEEGGDPDPVDLGIGQVEARGHRHDDRGDQRRRLPGVVGARCDDRGERRRRGVAGDPPDLDRPGPAARRDGGSRDTGVLAEYIAASASRARVSVRSAWPIPPATPIEIVTERAELPSTLKTCRATRLRSFSARTAPSSTSVSVRRSMNSSPP